MATSIEFLKTMLPKPNIQAALNVIRHTEGTTAEDGYQYMFGSSPRNDIRFHDYSTHPNIVQRHNGIASTAAGAYQILKRTYDWLCETYGFKDFQPGTQDLMCLAIFDSIGVLTAVSKGKMLTDDVMTKLSKQWASLPYAGYNQPTHTMADVREKYLEKGGSFA